MSELSRLGPRVRAAQHFVSRGVEQLDGRLHAQTLCIRSASRAASGNIFGRSSASLPRSPMSGRIAQEQSDLGRRGCAIAEHSRSIAAELRLEARDASRGSEGRERIGIRAQRPTLATPKPHVILTTREDVTPPRSAPSGELSFMFARRTDGHGWGGWFTEGAAQASAGSFHEPNASMRSMAQGVRPRRLRTKPETGRTDTRTRCRSPGSRRPDRRCTPPRQPRTPMWSMPSRGPWRLGTLRRALQTALV